MDEALTPDVVAWLHDLVSRQVVEAGHPDACIQADIALRALDQLVSMQGQEQG